MIYCIYRDKNIIKHYATYLHNARVEADTEQEKQQAQHTLFIAYSCVSASVYAW